MRTPDIFSDGWCLEDGEEYHRAAPLTFLIPSLELRQNLQPGDLAKLIFRISVADGENTEAVERMWVIVTERVSTGYIGILDNMPSAIEENDSFWCGTELPFEPRHIIAVDHGNAASQEAARRAAPIPWADR